MITVQQSIERSFQLGRAARQTMMTIMVVRVRASRCSAGRGGTLVDLAERTVCVASMLRLSRA